MHKIIFSLIFSIILIFIKCNARDITVVTENGKINGFMQTFNGTNANVFLGIPYAEPPVGELRFRKPVPAKKWSEPLNATEWGSPCFQAKQWLDAMGLKNCSEDCLYLNIYSPISYGTNGVKKPVMFWIHQGAWLMGAASQDMYNPLALSTKGDVVVVSLNYRLATLGHLYTGTEDGVGNMALWDQALALKWISNNIANFGGDPKQITVFGESAGSRSISGHILSPITRDLFQNAIMMSGALVNYEEIKSSENSLKFWLSQAKLLGCNDKSEDKFSPTIIECLKKLPADKLVQLPALYDQTGGQLALATWFVVDGDFISKDPLKMLEQGDFKKNLSVLIGTVQDEGSNLLELFIDFQKFHPVNPKNFTYIEAYNELKQMSDKVIRDKSINGEEVAKMYFTGLSEQTDRDLLRQTIGVGFGDYLVSCHAIEFAKTLYRNDMNSNVYQYYYNSKAVDPFCGKWMGVCHTSDIIPVFGIPFLQPKAFTNKQREVSELMMDIVINFAKKGIPPAIGGAEWPKYYTVRDQLIAPYYEITNEPKLNTNFGNGLKIDECDYLWKPYFEVK